MAVLLALTAASGFGVADFLGGVATRRASAWSVTLAAHCTGAILILVFYAAARWLTPNIFGGSVHDALVGHWDNAALWWGGVGGLAGAFGLVLLLDALATGKFQLVSPISAVTSAAVPVIVGLATGERPTSLGIIAFVVLPVAIWLLAGGEFDRTQPAAAAPLLKAVAAGVGFGTFFTCLAQSPEGTGVLSLIGARMASIPLLVALASRYSGSIFPKKGRLLSAGSGIADIAANGFFLAASRLGQLSVVGAAAALYPASNAALARAFLGERLNRKQVVGFVLTLAAASMLSV